MAILDTFLFKVYGINSRSAKKIVHKLIDKIEGGEHYSTTLRRIFIEYYQVEIGLYTHGGCFRPFSFDAHTRIGRYCSVAVTARAFNRNHPLEYKSTHAFFFNRKLGYCENDDVLYIPLEIGNDVWIGHNAIIMPNVKTVGDGAIIAAGAVVNKDVPPYGVVVGNPGRVVRFRFPEQTIQTLIASRWWDKPIEELKGSIEEFQNFSTNPSHVLNNQD
jgi:virginiamycin A acetyltransferase